MSHTATLDTVDAAPLATRSFVFVGGLHRSGTTLVAWVLAAHPAVSGLRNTGLSHDEGQHLQSVYPRAADPAGPEMFGFASDAGLTDPLPLASAGNRDRLLSEWAPYWDREKCCLLEKSPPNLLRTRFLRALFPNSFFVIGVWHPIPVSLSTQRSSGTSASLLDHWITCHERFSYDCSLLDRVAVVRYERLMSDTEHVLDPLFAFVGLDSVSCELTIDHRATARYFEQWRVRELNPSLASRFERRVQPFGYSLVQPEICEDRWPFQEGAS